MRDTPGWNRRLSPVSGMPVVKGAQFLICGDPTYGHLLFFFYKAAWAYALSEALATRV